MGVDRSVRNPGMEKRGVTLMPDGYDYRVPTALFYFLDTLAIGTKLLDISITHSITEASCESMVSWMYRAVSKDFGTPSPVV